MAPVSEENHVLLQEMKNSGMIILNRPEESNVLSTLMIEKIYSALQKWENTKKLVIIKGVDDLTFSAGRDFKSSYSFIKSGSIDKAADILKKLYTLTHYINNYDKPYISIMEGITMGAGAGISVYGRYRIATENTLFSIPEAVFGSYPDAGISYILSRLKGKLGMFLALTGYRLKGVDVLHACLATHYVPSEKLKSVIDELILENSDIDAVLAPYLPEKVKLPFNLQPQIRLINECFSAPTVEEIIKRLREKHTYFANSFMEMLSKMSPAALKITKKSIDEASTKSLPETLIMEYRRDYRSLDKNSDTYEGTRAFFVDKDESPVWNFKTFKQISDAFVNEYFEPLPSEFELTIPQFYVKC